MYHFPLASSETDNNEDVLVNAYFDSMGYTNLQVQPVFAHL